MDDDGLNMPNWGYYEPPPKGSLSLQLMPTLADRNTKSFLSTREGSVMVNANTAFHHPRDCVASNAPIFPMDYMRNSWGNQRDKFLNVLPPGNHNYAVLPSPGTPHHLQMFQPFDVPRDNGLVKMEDLDIKKEVEPVRRSAGSSSTLKTPKLKKPKKSPGMPKDKGASSVRQVKQAKKNMDMVVNGISMDISAIPIPVCSCTGTPQQCYRWGCGGWQSACCTTSLSMHPLPMSAKRRGSRIAGRKMSQGAFKKVLERLAAEGYNFRNPIDLRTHWAKHGTNKYVTIK